MSVWLKAEPFALKERSGKKESISQRGEEPISRQSSGGRILCTRRGLGPRQALAGNFIVDIKAKGAG